MGMHRTAAAIGAGLALYSPIASAGNGTKPRILAQWPEAPCLTVVDRSQGSSALHLNYSIAREDVGLTDDEVADSRRHQFFALCRSHPPQSLLPRWITQFDVDRVNQLVPLPETVEAADIFETSPAWADCWHRINPDDARIPITFPAAAQGVQWDTASLPAGAYIVEAYTFEPIFNQWNHRPGVVKIVDSPDLTQSGPAVAIDNTEEVIHRNEVAIIEGCVSAMEGSTLSAYWSVADPEIEAQWEPFIHQNPVSGERFAVELSPPPPLWGEHAMVRVDITDPMGRTHSNYMREFIIVLNVDGSGSCSTMDDGGFIAGGECDPNPTDGAATEGASGATAASGAPTAGGGDETANRGCRTGIPPREPAGTLGLILWGLVGRRRRSRSGPSMRD